MTNLLPLMITCVIASPVKTGQKKAVVQRRLAAENNSGESKMEKRIETAINLIMFLSLLATAWDLSLVHHLCW